ncbi:hypothetical protein J6590_036733 [Homalodisca vitripennis]|nr:hypothetical protein J6590_036733 [Homalodisca vitripennis]
MDQPKPGTPKDRPAKPDDDWKCGVCLKLFSEDVKKKNGAQWLQCSFCKFPYHEKCQKNPTKELIYMCDACEPFYGTVLANRDCDFTAFSYRMTVAGKKSLYLVNR